MPFILLNLFPLTYVKISHKIGRHFGITKTLKEHCVPSVYHRKAYTAKGYVFAYRKLIINTRKIISDFYFAKILLTL